MPRDELERRILVAEPLALADTPQVLLDVGNRDALEVETLATGKDGVGHLLRIGRAQDEHDMGRGFLERLEQCVECGDREHMHLVDHIYLVGTPGGGERHTADDLLANVLDTRTRGRIKLIDIGMTPLRNLPTGLTCPARVGRDAMVA